MLMKLLGEEVALSSTQAKALLRAKAVRLINTSTSTQKIALTEEETSSVIVSSITLGAGESLVIQKLPVEALKSLDSDGVVLAVKVAFTN